MLDATVSLLEQSFMVTVTDIAVRTGLETSDVARALEAMDPVYVDFRKTTTGGDARFWYVFKVTPEARRVVGQWPTAQALADRLTAELTAAARRETDGERQGLLTYAARLIGDTLRDATVEAAASVLAPAFGGVPRPELGTPLPASETPVPDAPVPDAPVLETPVLETPVLDTPAPDTGAPDNLVAPVPDASARNTPVPGTSTREELRSEATAPAITGPELEPLPEAATFPSSLQTEPAAGSSRATGA